MIRPISSQLAEFPRLAPTPSSSDEIGCSAVNRRVASSNLARGAILSDSANQGNTPQFRKSPDRALKDYTFEDARPPRGFSFG